MTDNCMIYIQQKLRIINKKNTVKYLAVTNEY